MSERIAKIVNQLLTERRELKAELTELETVIRQLTGKSRIHEPKAAVVEPNGKPPTKSETESQPRPRRRSTSPAQDQLKAKIIGLLQATKHTGATTTELLDAMNVMGIKERDRVRNTISRLCVRDKRIARLHHNSTQRFTYYALEFAPDGASYT